MHLDGSRWNPVLPTAVPVLVGTVELADSLGSLAAEGHKWAHLLVLAARRPIGWITCPVTNGRCLGDDIRRAVARNLSVPALSALLEEQLRHTIIPGTLTTAQLFHAGGRKDSAPPLPITVAICSKDRPGDLERCLHSVAALDYPAIEVIVVDNAPTSEATCEIVSSQFPGFRYVREERVGLNWARNRALALATGRVIAFTDDDAVVDAAWLSRIAVVFQDEDVAAVTGLIAPLELRTTTQLHFEVVGGFGRGCRKEWYRVDPGRDPADVYHLGAGRFGAGANMAFRTRRLREMGGFDPALDVGTGTEGGGDLELFFRILHEGHTLVYEPAALVWHKHRDAPEGLKAQLNTWGTAMGAFLSAGFVRYPRFRAQIMRFAARWSWFGYIGPAFHACVRPGAAPKALRFGPLRRLPIGPYRYAWARRLAKGLGAAYGRQSEAPAAGIADGRIAVRTIDLATGIDALGDISSYESSQIHVFVGDQFLGVITIENRGHPISAAELRMRIARDLYQNLLQIGLPFETVSALRDLEDLVLAQLDCRSVPRNEEFRPALASIVVATCNRPQQLRRCLESLSRQEALFPFEIVVVNNGPEDSETEAIVRQFGMARYVGEPVRGLAPARNTGFRAARGDILVATDDDIVAPPGWLQEIVQPFRFAHVGVSTGRVLPLTLEHPAQRDFESVGALDKGPRSFEVGLDWLARRRFLPPRTWDLGATANAAFRRSMLEDPRVGLLSESLGPGTPAGGGEDVYLFYRAVKAGYGLCYNADAMLRHEHRTTQRELRRQMFDYGRGHVAYLLTTFVYDGDLRAMLRLLTVLPAWHLWRLLSPLRRPGHRRTMVAAELLGYLAGPFSWLRGRMREHSLRAKGRIMSPLNPAFGGDAR